MYTIRPATLADADRIAKIAHRAYWPTYTNVLSTEQITYMLGALYVSDHIGEQIDDGTQNYLVLEDDEIGKPVAFAAYSPRAEDAEVYKLHKLYCLPQTQGKGYGKNLLNAVIDITRKAGKKTLELNVNRDNTNARGFYEKMGFEVAYDEDVPIGQYFMNDHVMRKML